MGPNWAVPKPQRDQQEIQVNERVIHAEACRDFDQLVVDE
jgi:hypothetical protein